LGIHSKEPFVTTIWRSKYVQILTVFLLLQAALFYTASHGDALPLKEPLREFPQKIGGWNMAGESTVDKDTWDTLKADDVLSRVYLKGGSAPSARALPADLFLAYFKSQQQGQTPHSPKNCLPGAGFQPVESGEITVPIGTSGQTIKINKYVVEKDGNRSLVLYWFQSHGRVVANEFSEKYYMIADSLRFHRSDTAFVRVMAPVAGDQASAVDQATGFVQAVYPEIYHFLPM
jgi:EpsI family protein